MLPIYKPILSKREGYIYPLEFPITSRELLDVVSIIFSLT
nr:MAG TPA: hypothetical protein [Caudoviricetes sp.]